MANKVSSTQEYINLFPKWKAQLTTAQKVLESSPLVETIKWGAPCYTYNGTNLIGLAGFKNHCAIWFHKGSLLKDETDVFENAQPGKTKYLRQIRYCEGESINVEVLTAYIKEAIEIEKNTPKKLKSNKTAVQIELSTYLEDHLNADSNLKNAFESLSPYRRKEYHNYIFEAKRETTKKNRIIKIAPLIMDGKGLHDQYKK